MPNLPAKMGVGVDFNRLVNPNERFLHPRLGLCVAVDGLLKAADEMSQPKLSGAERLGSVDTWIISGDVDAGNLRPIATDAESGRMVPTQVWVGKEDSFVYRIKLSGPISSTEPKNIVRQIDLSLFNERLDITPPVTGSLESNPSA